MPVIAGEHTRWSAHRLSHTTLGTMDRNALVVVALCAGLVAGCGSDDSQLTQKQVERRVATLVGNNEGGHAEATCVEGSVDRVFRCEVAVNSIASTYEARVSKGGKKIELEKR